MPPLASVMLAVQNAAPIRGEHLFASPFSTVKAEDETMPNNASIRSFTRGQRTWGRVISSVGRQR